ncbi:TetR/AcrR family transcriptional regulator [Streptomyces sp. NPDC088350]|uniref:TetR/AcrR family transcriptional regulator n=1 Tax=Streptomyces sp. NPDC088350 TaxID=3365854 RepID=UPI00380FD375
MTSRPGDTPRHTRNPRGKGERLRQDLISAANRLLENGATHESLSLRAVAREVGIAATSVYLHFPDKVALLLAVYQQHFADLARQLDDAVAQHTSPAAQLRAAIQAYYQFATDHPDAYHVMFTVPTTTNPRRAIPAIPDGERPGAAVIQTVQNVITRCIDARLIQPVDPYPATLCLWAAVHGLITLRAARPTVPWPDFDALLDALLTTWLTAG